MNEEIINYAKGMNADKKVFDWLEKRFPENKSQTEIEHIIDYLVSDKAPKRLDRATYDQIKKKTESWNNSLIKKGGYIKETKKDTEVVLDFKDGFKIVKLIGKNAYKREGYLMRHCVSSYYNSNEEIYSLRDKDNNPHATMSSSSNQIKGKGNGSINPKYVKYVVDFLEYKGMEVKDNEMKNLGYVNVEEIMKKEKDLVFPNLFKDKYFYKSDLEKIKNKNRISLWRTFGIFNFNSKLDVKYNFNIEKSISHFRNKLSKIKKKTSSNEVAMTSYNEVAMVNDNKVAMTDYNKVAMTCYNEVAMADSNEVAMADYNKVAMSCYNEVAMADSNKVAMADSNKVAMTCYNKVAMTSSNKVAMADYNKVAMTCYNEVAMTSSNKVAMADYNNVKCGENNVLAGYNNNEITIGDKSIAVMGNCSKIKGKVGACFVLYERDKENNIIFGNFYKIDGKKIKEDIFYKLKNKKLIEVE